MSRWTFLRHGESVANADGWVAGHTDSPLTARGRQEAISVRDPLQDLPFQRVITSDLCRAFETARLAVPNLEAEVFVGLRERSMGEWEGCSHTELEERGLKDVVLSAAGRPPGGESHQQLTIRVLTTLAELERPVDTLVVAHGGVLRAVLGALDGVASDAATRIRFPNVGLQTREVAPGTWRRLLSELQPILDDTAVR